MACAAFDAFSPAVEIATGEDLQAAKISLKNKLSFSRYKGIFGKAEPMERRTSELDRLGDLATRYLRHLIAMRSTARKATRNKMAPVSLPFKYTLATRRWSGIEALERDTPPGCL
jgi:hypothetical protein